MAPLIRWVNYCGRPSGQTLPRIRWTSYSTWPSGQMMRRSPWINCSAWPSGRNRRQIRHPIGGNRWPDGNPGAQRTVLVQGLKWKLVPLFGEKNGGRHGLLSAAWRAAFFMVLTLWSMRLSGDKSSAGVPTRVARDLGPQSPVSAGTSDHRDSRPTDPVAISKAVVSQESVATTNSPAVSHAPRPGELVSEMLRARSHVWALPEDDDAIDRYPGAADCRAGWRSSGTGPTSLGPNGQSVNNVSWNGSHL